MELFIGTKLISAEPMTRAEYNTYRGWELPADENGDDAGYLVEYLDGGQTNHPDHKGYISWSPEDVFGRAYKRSGELTFGMAVECLKLGMRIARKGWNGKGMFLFLVPANAWEYAYEFSAIDYTDLSDFICMKTADDKLVPWLASQADVLAEDWEITGRSRIPLG